MTPFIAVCSYVSMLSLALLLLCIVLYRVRRVQGKDTRAFGFYCVVCTFFFLLGVILIGIFYR